MGHSREYMNLGENYEVVFAQGNDFDEEVVLQVVEVDILISLVRPFSLLE